MQRPKNLLTEADTLITDSRLILQHQLWIPTHMKKNFPESKA